MDSMQNNRSSRLFLIELIFAVLFFSLGSAVCVQAFAQAHTVSAQARDLAFASSTVSSAASVVRASGDDLAAFRERYPQAFGEAGEIRLCFGTDFGPCDPDAAAYTLRIQTQTQGRAVDAHLWMEDGAGREIYGLQLRSRLEKGGGGA